MSWRALAVMIGLLGCSVPNPDHCANLDGDATCKARDPARPYCSACVGANDGCVAEPVVDAKCGGGSSGSTGASTGGGTTAPTTSSTAGSTDATATTGAGTTEASTGTTTGATTEASSGTTGDMTSGTSGTGGTTGAGPMCGDGEIAAMEACDGDQFGGKTCLDFGQEFGGGTLKCAANCTIDISGCCKIKGKQCFNNETCCSGSCLFFICQ